MCECSKGHKLILFSIETCEALGRWTVCQAVCKRKYNMNGIRGYSTNA